ncbi:hypothetical protein [Burkholderia cepacia]|uniref:hypothetical protein n=1 Tax=Burkholderia cepacia TaxID=292 RepID=UPI002AB5F839|nr:hypothetical protein [Burkholderia cepacia]
MNSEAKQRTFRRRLDHSSKISYGDTVGWLRRLMRRQVALRYFHIGAASTYVVKLLAGPLLGGKPG